MSENQTVVGEVLGGRYILDERLGAGAMGVVYRAHHLKFDRRFAVKILHPHLANDPRTLLRFQREAELAGKLLHRNLVAVLDVDETQDGLRYIVMEYVEGVSLAELIACSAPVRVSRAINLLRQLLEGLAHAHKRGLIHRDLKPDNIHVELDHERAEVVRILDFGIALDDSPQTVDDRLTTEGLVLGTPAYMAPEHATGGAIDHRIDLFALGIVAYELLTGLMPFDGSGVEVALANSAWPMPPMNVRAPDMDVDPLVEAFVMRLVARDRDQRPATATIALEWLALIERDRTAAAAFFRVALPATAAPTSPIPIDRALVLPPPQPLRRPRATGERGRGWLGSAIAALALAGGITYALIPRDARVAPAPIAIALAPAPEPVHVAERTTRTVPRLVEPREPELAPIAPVARTSVAPPVVAPPIVAPAPAAKPAPVAATEITSDELAKLYIEVGGRLTKLSAQDATIDALHARYRRIQLLGAMATAATRQLCADELRAIRDAAALVR